MPDVAAVTLAVPGSIDARTGGTIYDKRIAEALGRRGWAVSVREIAGSFPQPSADALERASQALTGVPAGGLVVIDGLLYGSIADVVAPLARRLRMVALVHLPLAAAAGLDATTATALADGERRALGSAAMVIITGAHALTLMADWDLSHRRVVVVEPGTEPAPLAAGSASDEVHLVTVGAVTAGKGHERLVDALASVSPRHWRLTCAGSLVRDPATVARVNSAIARHGLEDRVTLAGDLDRAALDGLMHVADVFVLATDQETYGMAVAEALARGLPVVSTRTGAIPTLVGSDAGLVVAPRDGQALTSALARIIGDPGLRARCAAGARRVRETLPDWDHAARQFATALESLDG
jgi:glycosyltransferase involved in cell wall biosynthesis